MGVAVNLRFVHPVSPPSRITYDALAALARQGLGKARLAPNEAAEVRAAVERHKQRQAARGIHDPLDAPGRYARRFKQKMQDAISAIFCRHYRTPYSRWVDVDWELHLSFGPPSASTSTHEVWHPKRPWRATGADFYVSVPYSWRRDVLEAGLAEAGGLLTLAATPVAPDAWQATWVVQGKGYDIRAESGYIVRAADGTFAHARTLHRARAIAEGRARKWSEAQRLAAERKRSRVKDLLDRLGQMSREEISASFGALPISIRDSQRAGNCPVGTRSWVARWAGGRTSGTIADALATGAPLDTYLLRALAVAITRHQA